MADDTPPPAASEAPPVDQQAPPPPAAEGAPPPPPAEAPPPAGTIPESVFNRIDRLTKDKKVAEETAARQADALRAAGIDPVTLQPLAAPPPPVGQQPLPPPPALPAAEIERRAQELVQQRTFTEQCNTVAAAGEAAHKDFGMKMGQLNALGVMSPAMITATLEIGDAHEILYALGGDLNEAARIAALSPSQQAIALIKFNDKRKTEAAKHISKAPPPPADGVGGSTPISNDNPSPTDKADDWFRKREKQVGIKSGNYD